MYLEKKIRHIKVPTGLLVRITPLISQMGESYEDNLVETINNILIIALEDKRIYKSIYNRCLYLKRKQVVRYKGSGGTQQILPFRMRDDVYNKLSPLESVMGYRILSTLTVRIALDVIHKCNHMDEIEKQLGGACNEQREIH